MGSKILPKWASKPCSYLMTFSMLSFADVDVIDPRELSTKMLKKNKINLNEILHSSAMSLIDKVLKMEVLLTEVKTLQLIYTFGDARKYEIKLPNSFPSIKFPIVSGASIVAKVTRDHALREWVLDETVENMQRFFGFAYLGDPQTKSWLEDHKHHIFGFPSLV
ncbi:hypothetical protein JHK82_018791 [Glycine max]|uniref:Ribonuclease n=2 Tax=Glycine subgen. Soja TaxID=1462606 RepID=A0A0R0J8M8_SOYBN|nr:hypothetical protein JHK87_018684 [Glycine soja]KAG5022890.1 hypothetical protein JHK85_019232 [Glycine max]KAG5037968.1 hypothetical protein JHK86_018808 [Glycine max]KAG5143096.1 hypothetical protein JHK82_018791 [Glycine max]KRH49554.1 hypothetical protein GLYMA_07G162800v4 [Glycine max]